jgi:hypothetical protein
MNKIIVTTDFSASSANALNYACELTKGRDVSIVLAHIYTVPAIYAAEGITIAALHEDRAEDEDKMADEMDRILAAYPDIVIEPRVMTGDFAECLQEMATEPGTSLIVMGAVQQYPDLWLADDDWLNALITVSCPVMVIPEHVSYSPAINIAFAADYKAALPSEQTIIVKRLVELYAAKFYVVHVVPEFDMEEEDINTEFFDGVFADLDPEYHTVENKSVIKGLAEFIQQYYIDILIVMPHKHGLWYNLFKKSYTRRLALLNYLPVMAIHEK